MKREMYASKKKLLLLYAIMFMSCLKQTTQSGSNPCCKGQQRMLALISLN